MYIKTFFKYLHNCRIMGRFFRLRNKYWNCKDFNSVVFIKHILDYFYDYGNEIESENLIIIPGTYNKADEILYTLGYRNYSISEFPATGTVYKCKSTKIVFHNSL